MRSLQKAEGPDEAATSVQAVSYQIQHKDMKMNVSTITTDQGGDAMKITRRRFVSIAAALGAAGVPTAVIATPVEPAKPSVRDLIAAHAAATADASEFDRLSRPIYEDPNRPPLGKVFFKEFRMPLRLITHKQDDACYVQTALDNILERRKHQIGLLRDPEFYEEADKPAAQALYDSDLSQAEAEHARLSAILKERDDAYQRWEIESGWHAANEQSEKLWSRAFDLGEEILSFECHTFDDVRAVAGFIRAEYGDEYAADEARDFIKRLAGETGGAE